MRQLLLLIVFGSIAIAQETATKLIELDSVPEAKILEDEGELIRVIGFVSSTNVSASGINFINFADTDFVCVTFGRHVGNFPDGQPADIYKEKWLEVSGEIENYRGKPQIRIESPDQVKIVDAPPPKPPEPEPAPVEVVEEKKPEEPKPEPAKPEPVKIEGRELEVVNGIPAIDWRKYFPE